MTFLLLEVILSKPYPTALFLLLTPFNLLANLSEKAAQELPHEGRKETKISLNSNLYFWG